MPLTIPLALEILSKWGPIAYDKAVELHKIWKLKQQPTDEQWGSLVDRINALKLEAPQAPAAAPQPPVS